MLATSYPSIGIANGKVDNEEEALVRKRRGNYRDL